MKKLIARKYVIKKNMLAIIGFCLLCYFSYHALLGERSTIRLMSLERQIAKTEVSYDGLHAERTKLESRVVMLRPGSIDRDLLEERAQAVLGYYPSNAKVILN